MQPFFIVLSAIACAQRVNIGYTNITLFKPEITATDAHIGGTMQRDPIPTLSQSFLFESRMLSSLLNGRM